MAIEKLKKSEIFSDCTQEELERIASVSLERHLRAGEEIIREGSLANSLFIVEEGSVDVHKRIQGGGESVVAELTTGAVFGESSFLDAPPRSAGVVAHCDVSILEIPYDVLEKLAVEDPALGVKIYRGLALSSTRKLKRTTSDLIGLVASSRLTAVGEMASHLAHEINNPLATIQLIADAVRALINIEPIDKPSINKSLEKITIAVKHVSAIIQGVQAVVRESAQDPFTVESVSKIVGTTLGFCKSRLSAHGVKLVTGEIPAEIGILCRPPQICQVLLNLLNNSCDAVHPLPEKWVRLEVQVLAETVEISVTDSGNGIPPEIQSRIFEPFFTTKPSSQGTGLGLSISRKTILEHKGELFLDERSAKTRFVIRLPLKPVV